MMRFERTGMGETILIQDGEHVLVADSAGDPACACGFTPRGAVSQIQAASLIARHANQEGRAEGETQATDDK